MDNIKTDSTPRRARGRPRGWDDKTAQNTIKSLDRAMGVFEYLSENPGLALSEIATRLDQSPATIYRILVTLEGRGLVEFDAAAQVWQIGSRAFVIGARFLRRTSLVERARPFLRQLMEETGETANLGIVQGANVLFVSQVETQATIRAFFAPGTLSPLHSSGIGKALLSQMDPARRDRLLGDGPFEAFTPHTLTDSKALSEDLAHARALGFAEDREEKNLGMRCIAAPVFDVHNEAVAGISVSGPTNRMAEGAVPALGRAVTDAARDLTLALGGSVPA